MILFLDTVSPLPEFSLIKDNKIIYSKKILNSEFDKMSDSIISSYLEVDNKFLLSKNLELLIVNTGPGSYTSLRVGIAFLSGLSLSKNINLISVSCCELFCYAILKDDYLSSAIIIQSSNNQKYICLYSLEQKSYYIKKIESDRDLIDIERLKIKKLFTNSRLLKNEFSRLEALEYFHYDFSQLTCDNIDAISVLPKKDVIEPIYISNNKILN